MIDVITVSRLKKDLLSILKEIEKGSTYLVIRKGTPSAVLVNCELFESLVASAEALKNKELLKKLVDEED